jgi:hypothetical protein
MKQIELSAGTIEYQDIGQGPTLVLLHGLKMDASPWDGLIADLAADHRCVAPTLSARDSPHVTAVGALWLDGTFWFQTGAGTRKGRNVARDPRCSVAVSVRGADVVIEGDAARVTEPGALARVAKAWADNGWPAEPDDSGPGITAPFNAPSQGPPPWNVYRIGPLPILTLAGQGYVVRSYRDEGRAKSATWRATARSAAS